MFWCVEHNLIKNDNKGMLLYVYDAIQYAPECIEKQGKKMTEFFFDIP